MRTQHNKGTSVKRCCSKPLSRYQVRLRYVRLSISLLLLRLPSCQAHIPAIPKAGRRWFRPIGAGQASRPTNPWEVANPPSITPTGVRPHEEGPLTIHDKPSVDRKYLPPPSQH